MAFNIDHFLQQTPNSVYMNGIPGMFGYYSKEDNLSTIKANGYFTPTDMAYYASPGDLVMINATDGYVLQLFNASYFLINPF